MAVVVLALAGCRFGFFEHDTTTNDGRTGDSMGSGSNVDAFMIPTGPFGTPVNVANISDPAYQDDDPTLTEDMLEMFFDSDRPAGASAAMGDVFVSTRASTADPWGTPTLVTELASLSDDSTPDLSPDGLTMFFGSDRLTAGDRDLYVTTRADRQSPWSAPQRIAELASTGDDSSACISSDGLTLIFMSGRTGNGDLYQTTRPNSTSPWGTPTKVMNLDSPVEESQHWCNRDLTVIYLSHYPTNNLEIYMTTRASPSDTFAPPVPVSEVNTIYDDADPWLSPDLRTMYFFTRKSGLGDIYMTTR